MPRTLTCLTLFLFTLTTFADDNWPGFRGPTGDGHAKATGLPTTWSEKENVVWKTPVPGKAWASPVVWGDQIWLANAPEDGKTMSAVGIDRETGKVIHDVKVFDNPMPAFCIPFNSYASCTPAIEAGRVYMHFGSVGTACLETTTAKILWERRDLPCDHFRGPGSSVVIYKDLLLLTFDGFDLNYVAALDKKTGRTVWKTDRKIKYSIDNGDYHKAYSTPQVVEVKGKPQMISPAAEATIAYNPDTGDELWRVHHGGMNASARPLYGHDRLFLVSGHNAKVLAVRPDGKGNVTDTHIDWEIPKGAPQRASLLLIDDLLYMTNSAGVLTTLEAKTGKPAGSLRLSGAFSASPVYADGKIYLANESGDTFVVKPGREPELLETNKLDDGFMASLAVVGKAIYLRSKTHLYRIEKK